MNQLFFGDNLHVLRDHLAAESVDLIYLAPPFNSKRDYNLKADDFRSVMAVRDRESAGIALFISLEEPTRGRIADAASAGFYESATGKKFPRVQLLTIEGLLSGQQRAGHPDHQPDLNFKKAKAGANAAQKDLI
ncbi:MAG: hypothetical protein PHY43_11795 [Verrucomicrobiales bacterium]|nr:hypothetical protein [Verrucomicrobiales bacterium]